MIVISCRYRIGNNRFGFTLMEIMVVIIVIAILASVGGSMVISFVDQGRRSATKEKLAQLKKGFLAYQADVGRMPHIGLAKCSGCKQAYNMDLLDDILSYNDDNKNVLLTGDVNVGMKMRQYKKRWCGPYMDSEPSDFMYDAWGNPIYYVVDDRNLYLWSYGPEPYTPDDDSPKEVFKRVQNQDEYTDDLIVSIKRFKKKLN